MSNLRIIADNAIDRATLSATNTAVNFGVTNLQSARKSDVWRATSTSASITATWSSPETFQAVALPFCNWSPTATMRVRVTSESPVTNLITASEVMSASQWTRTNCFATPFIGYAPDGSFNAQFIREDAAVGAVHELRTPSVTLSAGTPYALSVFLKQGTRRYVRVGFSSSFSYNASSPYVIFDLQLGTVSSTAGSFVTGSITAAGNGWYRCNVFFFVSKSGTTTTNYIGLQSDATTATYAGDGASGVSVWGAQLEAIPVASASELVTNGTFDTSLAGWSTTVAGSSTVAWSSANGNSAAITGDGTNAAFLAQAIQTTAGVTYSLTFTLTSTGAIAKMGNTQNAGDIVNSPTLVGGSTYSIPFTATSSTTWISFTRTASGTVYVDNVSVKRLTYTAASTSYYPSLDTFTSRASTATYTASDGTMKTVAINAARMSYNPYNLSAPPKLVLEVASTNLLTASGTLTTGWSGCNIAAATGTMFRAFETYQIVSKATTSTNEARLQSIGTVAIGTRITLTVALRAGSVSTLSLGLYDFSTSSWGANGDSYCTILEGPGTFSQSTGGLWIVGNLQSAADTIVQITRNYVSGGTGQVILYPGNHTSTTAGDSVLVTRVQAEAQGWPSSYIPTTTTTVTRSAEVWTTAAATRPTGYVDTWQSYTYDSGAQLACPAPTVTPRRWTAAQGASAYAFGGGACARLWLPSAVQAYTVTVDIVDTGNLQGYLEASALVVGAYWESATNFDYGASARLIDTSKSSRNDAGDQITDTGTVSRALKIPMSKLAPADQTTLWNIMQACGTHYPVFASMFPGNADLTLEARHQVYGKFQDLPEMELPYFNLGSATFQVESV